jgi:hypothetical protein
MYSKAITAISAIIILLYSFQVFADTITLKCHAPNIRPELFMRYDLDLNNSTVSRRNSFDNVLFSDIQFHQTDDAITWSLPFSWEGGERGTEYYKVDRTTLQILITHHFSSGTSLTDSESCVILHKQIP